MFKRYPYYFSVSAKIFIFSSISTYSFSFLLFSPPSQPFLELKRLKLMPKSYFLLLIYILVPTSSIQGFLNLYFFGLSISQFIFPAEPSNVKCLFVCSIHKNQLVKHLFHYMKIRLQLQTRKMRSQLMEKFVCVFDII